MIRDCKSVIAGHFIIRRGAQCGLGEETLDQDPSQVGLSLMFACGNRPSARDIERLVAVADFGAAFVSHRPQDEAVGVIELLINGLTFDLAGLGSGAAANTPDERHRYGTIADYPKQSLEAITLTPAHHIASGFAMIPVIQAMAGLAAHFARMLEVVAVCWHPAQTWMEPQYYAQVALNWISGGPFPALGLTALQENSAGFRTEGLGFFVGQELQVDVPAGQSKRDAAKLAVRLIDRAICEGRFAGNGTIDGPDAQPLQIEVSDSGRLATVRHLA